MQFGNKIQRILGVRMENAEDFRELQAKMESGGKIQGILMSWEANWS